MMSRTDPLEPRSAAAAAQRAFEPLDSALATALQNFAAHDRVLIALDFDGTLAPEVDDPERARALPEAHDAIVTLAIMPNTTVALVSGRTLASLAATGGMPDHVPLVGSHGLELRFGAGDARSPVDDADRARVLALRSRLAPLIDGVTGAWIEDKPAGFAVHTRAVEPSQAAALNDAVRAEALITDTALTVRDGKNVVEFAVHSATKGDGIHALRERFAPDALLFAGDDVTDEDALAALRSGDLGIKVGSAATIADHRLADPHAVAAMLRTLAELRAELRAEPRAEPPAE